MGLDCKNKKSHSNSCKALISQDIWQTVKSQGGVCLGWDFRLLMKGTFDALMLWPEWSKIV